MITPVLGHTVMSGAKPLLARTVLCGPELRFTTSVSLVTTAYSILGPLLAPMVLVGRQKAVNGLKYLSWVE